MIKIEITDPHLMPKREVMNLAVYLFACVGEVVSAVPPAAPEPEGVPVMPLAIPKEVFNNNAPSYPEMPPTMEMMREAYPITGTDDPGLDTAGHPWDGRIHTKERTRMKNGTWKLRRGVDMGEVIRIRNEFDAAMGIMAPAPIPVAAAPVPPPPPVVKPLDFNELVLQVGAAIAGNQVTHEQINTILGELSIPSLPLLGSRPDLLPYFHARFTSLLGDA